jgi:hypothetical protein
MPSGTLNVRLRPLRLAFVVPAGDRESVREAIKISSFLWGGLYNPIIPFYSRRPKKLEALYWGASAKEIFNGYLEAFDPDYVVKLGSLKNEKLPLGHRTELEAAAILDKIGTYGTPAYGIGLSEILGHLLHEEFRFHRQHKETFHLPQVGDDLFLASVFGKLTPDIESRLHKQLADFLDFKDCPCERKDFAQFLRPGNWFIRRISDRSIYPEDASLHRHDYVFLMDANNLEDILLYWNMRALGWCVIPLPNELINVPEVRAFVETWVEKSFWPWRGNPSIYNNAVLLKSPSISEQEMEAFGKSLSLEPVPSDGQSWKCKLSYQTWIPRFWNDWDRVHNGAARAKLHIHSKKFELNNSGDGFEFAAQVPEFSSEHGQGNALCANELDFRVYGTAGLHAEVIPEGGEKLVRAVDPHSFEEMRCSQSGMVYFPHFTGWDKSLRVPAAEIVGKAWFEERGWSIELSDKGHIIKHLLSQMGGAWGARWLTEAPVLQLLDKIANEQWLKEKTLRGLIRQLTGARHLPQERLLEWLIETNIIRLGAEVICPECRQRSWYSVTELDYALQCRQCLQKYPLPSNQTKEICWAYHGFGAFRSPRQTQGGLAVILLLRLFGVAMHDQITPLLSFNARRDGREMEVDLALFAQRMRYGVLEQDVIFAECKTHWEFQAKDVRRMEDFARQFPGATVVFSTLNKTLSKREKAILKPAVNRGRKLWKEGRPYTQVIILTGNELFSCDDPNTTWRSLGGEYARFADRRGNHRALLALADSTQQLYLGLPPWEQSVREKLRNRAAGCQSGSRIE